MFLGRVSALSLQVSGPGMCPSPSLGWWGSVWDLSLPPEQLGTSRHWNKQFLYPACDPKFLSREVTALCVPIEVQWSTLTAGRRVHLDPFHWDCGARNKAQGGFAKPVSVNGSMEHVGLGLLGGLKGTKEGLRSWGRTHLQVRERRRMWSRQKNGKIGQAASTKGYSSSAVTCRVPRSSGLHVPDGIVGIKAARGSIWDLPAERD